MRPIVNMSEDRATDIGNMHKKFGKDCLCGSGDIVVDRQADTHTHHNTLQPLSQVKQQLDYIILFMNISKYRCFVKYLLLLIHKSKKVGLTFWPSWYICIKASLSHFGNLEYTCNMHAFMYRYAGPCYLESITTCCTQLKLLLQMHIKMLLSIILYCLRSFLSTDYITTAVQQASDATSTI